MVDLSPWYKFTDKGYAHNTLVIYERLLSGKDIKYIMEIGVLNGDSIRMWNEVFPDANVLGIDINDTSSLELESDNIFIIHGDAYDDWFMQDLLCGEEKFYMNFNDYDLIVEDGSHILRDQCLAARFYPNFLSTTGIMIIEDIASIEDAHLIQQFIPEEFKNDSFIIDRRGSPCDYPYEKFEDRNEILLVIDRRG